MAIGRDALALTVPALAGGDIVKVTEKGSGWPALAEVRTPKGTISVALYVGPIGLSQRGRDDVERRFQNPGSNRPILSIPNRLPILLGIWSEDAVPILAGLDATVRLGRTTRQSLFVPLHLLRSAATSGWAEHHSTTGERVVAFRPQFLPVYVEMIQAGVEVDPIDIATVLRAAGADNSTDANAVDRGRRTASQLVRDASFSKDVRAGYGGLCAMCGLNYSLVVGAHIYPVSAPGAPDTVWNGIALCHNHHAAFDAHLVFVEPRNYSLQIHPSLIAGAKKSPACEAFVASIFPELQLPSIRTDRPRSEMFEKRYEFYDPQYDWAT